jgi:hypothetical protein
MWRLFPAQSLKGRAGNYSLHLEARDAGQPPLSASATFLICVQVTKKILHLHLFSDFWYISLIRQTITIIYIII